jgi:two-component system sensor histidine kinase CreC
MRVYVTDANGIVVFDSDNGRDVGKDYSQWNDVFRTLQGQYGARTTPVSPDDPTAEVLYVASPVQVDGRIVGALTVCQPAESIMMFLQAARTKIAIAGVVAALAVGFLGMLVSMWITRPIQLLTGYALAVRDGRRAPPPPLGSSEIGVLGRAFEQMRAALEGKDYVENYVQTLTHQMKSPLSSIRGTAELLDEDMPPEQRKRFLENLRSEASRIEDLIDRMLQLASLENRAALHDVESIDLAAIVAEVIEGVQPVLQNKRLRAVIDESGTVSVRGERFLLRQALTNLLENAVDFSPEGGEIRVTISTEKGEAVIRVEDSGPGVPDYALERVFDRFYSLPRPDTGRKSSGLGLSVVRQIAELHGGRATITNQAEGGAAAILVIPLDRPPLI